MHVATWEPGRGRGAKPRFTWVFPAKKYWSCDSWDSGFVSYPALLMTTHGPSV